jgi:hypothetical protein
MFQTALVARASTGKSKFVPGKEPVSGQFASAVQADANRRQRE